jgi:energy-converting hydrogenase B subunit Q
VSGPTATTSGRKISVDTIALVGEENIAAAVRAVADLPRARLLVLAGSIMGGDIAGGPRAPRAGHPDHRPQHGRQHHQAVDLVVTDPVRPGRWLSWRSPTRRSTSPASAGRRFP